MLGKNEVKAYLRHKFKKEAYMCTATEKSITLQLLEDLLFALKKVLPNIHSPLGISYQLLALLADAKFLNHRLKDLENEWEQRLPFGEGDDKDVDWGLWKKDFHPEKIKPFLMYLVNCMNLYKKVTDTPMMTTK